MRCVMSLVRYKKDISFIIVIILACNDKLIVVQRTKSLVFVREKNDNVADKHTTERINMDRDKKILPNSWTQFHH